MSDITFKHHDPNVMLELWHVTKRFGGLTAVGDVSFKIKKGEIYALIGPNGAGKTTIFNLITGVYALTEGRVIFDGTVVGQGDAIIKDDMRETDVKPFRKQPYDIMSRGMARTFQNIRLFKSETVYNNVLTACHAEADYNIFQSLWRLKVGPKWLTKYYYQEKALREKTEELLKIMGIWEQRDMIAVNLPYGQQRKLEIARALATEPKLLLLDEPLAALDLKLRQDMQYELIRLKNELGITFIYVTHDQSEAMALSDNIIIMNHGVVEQMGTPQEIYYHPKNEFVADFIGESNIIDGIMVHDKCVKMYGREFPCVDGGFAPNEPVDVVIRPEDIDIVPVEQGQLVGTVTSVTFKGMQYDIIVDFRGFKWLIQTTDYCPVDAYIGIRLNPEDIHIMHKSEYSGLYGDYSSYSAEYDEIADASEEEADEE